MTKQKNLEKKLENENARAAKEAQDRERDEAANWSVGAKDSARQRQLEDKEEEKRRKAAEKSALQAAEEAELSGVARVAKPKKKGKDDCDMLKQVLASQPKTKAQKEAELKKQQDDERKKKEQEAREAKAARLKAEEELVKQAAANRIVLSTDHLMVPINNRLDEDDFEDVRGLDAAIDVMAVSGGKVDDHPERRQKALYNAYYHAQLPILKSEYPGLRLSQYKERIFDMWKTAPENPHNQRASALASKASTEEA